ncbi:PO21 protein, partial [Rhabdornis inornatus]|nr:PO21 protein [Rhabdornis inornatus]
KAFDTISHQHIITGLEQRGFDPHIIHLIKDMYKNTTTYIGMKNEKTDPINILSGVKQGYPMSPMLFHLAIDLLLRKLEKDGKGFQRGGLKITAMAFADDLVLLSNSWDGMCTNIKILETFCELTGLQTQGKE